MLYFTDLVKNIINNIMDYGIQFSLLQFKDENWSFQRF
jgi:hypothetical protein